MSQAALAAGFDIGGTNLRALVVAPNGTGHHHLSRPRPADGDGIVASVAEMFAELNERTETPVRLIGAGCAGIVDWDGVVRRSPNIASLVHYPLEAAIAETLGDAADCVAVGNDANMAAYAETQIGAARGHQLVLFVTLGTGIGVGIVADGVVFRGAYGAAGESGHITIVEGGIPCPCGRRGCWERYASGTALGRISKTAAADGRAPQLLAAAGGDPEGVESEMLADLVANHDHGALAVLDEFAHWVAVGAANLVNTIDPSAIVIGGGVSGLGEPLRAAVERAYHKVMVDRADRGPVDILLSSVGDDAGAIGAGLVAMARRSDQ